MTFDKYEYKNQYGDLIKIPKETKTILISFEKTTSKLINETLDEEKNIVFIADISNVPSFLISIFVLSSLQDYKHEIFLNYDDSFKDNIIHKDEKITVVKLQNKKIINISFISTKQELEILLKENR